MFLLKTNVIDSVPRTISPTQVATAKKCRLRYLLDSVIAESNMALPSSSAFRYLGIVYHRVIEAARFGRVGDPPQRQQIEKVWEEETKRAEQLALGNGDRVWVPFTDTISKIERLRLSALKNALGQTASKRRGGNVGRTEVRLSTPDGLVVGKVDAIEKQGGNVVLRDFKSGELFDTTGKLKPEYVDQLVLYAALYEAFEGHWPDRLELVDRRGSVNMVSFSVALAQSMLSEATRILSEVQKIACGGGELKQPNLSALGNPEGGACGTCRHRPGCPPYIEKLGECGRVTFGAGAFPGIDLVGEVDEITPVDAGRIRLSLRVGETVATIQGVSPTGEFSGHNSGQGNVSLPELGARLAVFNLIPRRPLQPTVERLHLLPTRPTRSYLIPK